MNNKKSFTIIAIVIIVFLILCPLIIIGGYFVYKYYQSKSNSAPNQPQNVSLSSKYNPILKQQEWIISWSPSSGTSPITYYYNITTDSKAFISGKTNDTNLI